MKNEDFRGCLTSHGSADPHGKPVKNHLALLANRQLGAAWGLLLLTAVSGYAVYLGGTVIAEVTPTYIRVEVVGRPK